MRKHGTVALMSVLLLAGGCATTPPSDLRTEERASVDAQGGAARRILGGSYWFRPDRVVVKANTPVLLSMKKKPGIVPHTFVIHAPEAGIDVHPYLSAEPKTARFTPTRVLRAKRGWTRAALAVNTTLQTSSGLALRH